MCPETLVVLHTGGFTYEPRPDVYLALARRSSNTFVLRSMVPAVVRIIDVWRDVSTTRKG